jgi:hypothetical protein
MRISRADGVSREALTGDVIGDVSVSPGEEELGTDPLGPSVPEAMISRSGDEPGRAGTENPTPRAPLPLPKTNVGTGSQPVAAEPCSF